MKILVGISGGVDSAYAAKKLLSDGHCVEGAVLIMHEYTELSAAREAARSIGIKLHEIDCRKLFLAVKENFIEEYSSARTPNPCVICNEKVKFRALYDFATENGFDAIATGHYARVVEPKNEGEGYSLAPAGDARKDQSYMLYRLPQQILKMLCLPLSIDKKEDVRRLSREEGISAANREDSQEICFLPEGNYAEYIESVRGKFNEGDFIDTEGRVLGRHKGIIRYTVGQRKGLGISLGERAFVCAIDPVENTVTLSTSLVGQRTVEISDTVYSGITPPRERITLELEAKLRYSAPLVKTRAELLPDGRAILHFDSEVRCAPGQSAVLYLDGRVALGGFIIR